jgi:uncharacterized cupin superfamily protein
VSVLPEPLGRGGGITHFDEARALEFTLGHLGGRWTRLGEAAGCIDVGLRRMQVPAGQWSTPAHEHGREEEIFYVLDGRGISWQAGNTTEVGAGDCIVYLPRHGAHTMHALEDLDLLAFGTRRYDEAVRFPRLDYSLVGGRAIRSEPPTINGAPFQFARESQLGPPELSASGGGRPSNVVNVSAVAPERLDRPRVVRTRRNLGRAAGSVNTGLQHVEVAPGKESTAQHCHSAEEEIFVILDGDGFLLLGEDELPVRAGHVVSRPPATGVAHVFRAGASGLTLLAYGTREPNDICYYPRSNKISFRGVGVIARLERLEYWDGED